MLTNDERREVAEIMRDGTRFSVSSCAVAPRLGLDCEEFETCAECESMLADRLADLIEPEPERTCRNEFGRCFAFECSECGVNVEGGDMLGHNSSEGAFNFCPNCGAKVVE